MNRTGETRITETHRTRAAVVYVRQSSNGQVLHNTESTRVQFGLRDRAIALGWRQPIIVDDDLGISASGYSDRPGFKALLGRITLREVGIILCVEASRLSRSSKDWAQLLELCGHFDTLLADLDQIYDLSIPNDRLLVGIKGTISELELSTLRLRLRGGVESKAARGELRMMLPPGYVHDLSGRIAVDPDLRVSTAIRQMFEQFEHANSVRQLTLWYQDTHTLFPVRKVGKTNPLHFEIPTNKTLDKLLVHPIYAGAYTYGRRSTRVDYVDGSLIKRATPCLPAERARVLIKDHHEAYISWERLLSNTQKIAQNRPRWNMVENIGAPRKGLALLAGLLRCGRCGRKIYVGYNKTEALYYCDGGPPKGTRRCLSFGSTRIEERVSAEVFRSLEPLSIDAAIQAEENFFATKNREIQNANLRVQAAQYDADRAFDQYNAVDPRNRLVADTLEQRLNDRLLELDAAKRAVATLAKERVVLSDAQRTELHGLASNFEALWNHPAADNALKKRILRTIIEEIVVRHDVEHAELEIFLHWKGGVHTRVTVPKNPVRLGSKPHPELVELLTQLAESGLKDAEITRILNMKQMWTPSGLRWTQSRVQAFRGAKHIPIGAPTAHGELLSCEQAIAYLGVSRNALLTLIRRGVLTKQQITDFAPWRLDKKQLDSQRVSRLVAHLKKYRSLPRGESPENQGTLFDTNK